MKKEGNTNKPFTPDPNIPFWDQSLNPITMFRVIPNYYDHTKEIGFLEKSPFKRTNHFTKNFT